MYRKKINYNNFQTYRYQENDFPLNIYFTDITQNSSKFKILYDGVMEAISRFNNAFNFRFFTLHDNIVRYPNVVYIQIACGFHYGCISKFDGEGGILAHATYPPFRLVCIDCHDIDYKPLYVVIMHEFGHIVGLTHTLEQNVPSLMNAYINPSIDDFTHHDKERFRNFFNFLK